MKKDYKKPELKMHGSIEEVTQVSHDVFGGGFLSTHSKAKARRLGPSDYGS